MTIARSSNCGLETTHCPAAARHQELGTPRELAPMEVGTAVHHLVFAATMREKAFGMAPSDDPGVSIETADVVIDRTASDLVANGRSFDGGPVEHLRMEHVDRARDFALDFLDRGVIPERGDVSWLEAEVLVAVDRHFKRVDREMCATCGHTVPHNAGGDSAQCSHNLQGYWCPCPDFRPLAIWQQALDLAVIYQDEVDDEEVRVIEVTDYKGGSCSNGWFTSLQGKAAAVSAVALCPDADIVRRRVISYMPWGGSYSNDLDLRQQDDVDTLEDYQRAIVVAARGYAGRQGKTPDELAQPGAGCSGGFGGCPFLLVCRPFALQWNAINHAWGAGGQILDASAWASMYALAHAVKQEAGKRVKASMVDTDQVITLDGHSVVGWKERKMAKVSPNAALLLSEQWTEVVLRLDRGSPAAQLEQGRIEGVLMNALSVTAVKGVVTRLKEIIGYEEAAALEALCLEDDSGRQLKVRKKPAPVVDLMEKLKESIEAGPPPAPSGEVAAERNRVHGEKTDALLNNALKTSIEFGDDPTVAAPVREQVATLAVIPVGWRQWRRDQLKELVKKHKIQLGEPTGKTSPDAKYGAFPRYLKDDYVDAIGRWIKENADG